MLLKVRKRQTIQVSLEAQAASRLLNLVDCFGKRFDSILSAEPLDSPTVQQLLRGLAELGPELYLPGNGTLLSFAMNSSIKYEGVGKFDGLAHENTVA